MKTTHLGAGHTAYAGSGQENSGDLHAENSGTVYSCPIPSPRVAERFQTSDTEFSRAREPQSSTHCKVVITSAAKRNLYPTCGIQGAVLHKSFFFLSLGSVPGWVYSQLIYDWPLSDLMLLLHHSVWDILSKPNSSWSQVQGGGSSAGRWVHKGVIMKPSFIQLNHVASLSDSGGFFFFNTSAGSTPVHFCPASWFSSSWQKSRKPRNIDNMEHTGKCPGYRRPVMLGPASVPNRSLNHSA